MELWYSDFKPDRSTWEWAESDDNGQGVGVPTRIGGIASSYDTHVITGTPQWGVVQSLAPGCADAALADSSRQISLLFSHQGLPMAATQGAGLKVWSSDEGIAFSAERAEGCDYSEQHFRAVADGRIREMSWGFQPGQIEQSPYEPTSEEMEEWRGVPHIRHTNVAAIYDVSIVSRGRNPVTKVSAWAADFLEEEEEQPKMLKGATPVLLRPRPLILR